jgi:hypothetical protein
MGKVKSWVGLGCVEVGFIRLWVSHGETKWRDRDHYLEEMSCYLLLGYLRHSC